MLRWTQNYRGHTKDEPVVGYDTRKVLGLIKRGLVYGDADGTTYSTRAAFLKPTGAIAETVRRADTTLTDNAALASGTLFMVAVGLEEGDLVTNISFLSGTTAASVPTHWWFGLYDGSRNQLGVTADQTNTAWAANTLKTLALATPYVVTASGLYYLGIMMTATTPVSLASEVCGNAAANALPPILAGASTTGQTTPPVAPFQGVALTASVAQPFAYVS